MADTDDSQKTEEPTQKKLEEAHKQGQVPKSQEVKHWFMLSGMALSLTLFASLSVGGLAQTLANLMSHLGTIKADDGRSLINLVSGLLEQTLLALALPFIILIIAAIAGNMVQHKPVWTFEKMVPKLNKISPMSGLKRQFSLQAVVDFIKNLLKICIVGAVVLMLVWPERARLPDVVSYSPGDMLSLVFTLALRMIGGVIAIMTIVAAADFLFQKFQFRKQQRMSQQEVRDEYKQLEGDPKIKGRLRQIRMERSRQRMMAAVPQATVVITNPTHFAVALKYEHEVMDAPQVVAKGADAVALRIREVATENEVPIVENPPLARALFASVEIDDYIPPEHYKAVAEVIGFVLKLSKGKRR